MRYSTEHKQETRERVLKEAAQEIRAKGIGGVGVAGIMARAGLTHGGFYAHFASRDVLIAESLERMFADTRRRFERVQAEVDPAAPPADRLLRYIDFYLSQGHRDDRERGCPLPALSSDMARLEPRSRDRFSKGVQALTDRIAGLLVDMSVAEPEAEASSLLAAMVGAVSLSRAVVDPAQANAILRNTRWALCRRFNLDKMHE